LSIKGRRVDVIEKLPGRALNGVILVEAFEYAWWLRKAEDSTVSNEIQELPDQLWRTLVADRGPSGINAPTWYRRSCLEYLQHVDILNPKKIKKRWAKSLEGLRGAIHSEELKEML